MLSFNYIFLLRVMQALAAHLKRKNLKLLEQQLSLPKIEEKGYYQAPQTSARSRKPKLAPLKYVSETTLSPEEEHVQDQIRLILQKTPAKNYSLQKINLEASHRQNKLGCRKSTRMEWMPTKVKIRIDPTKIFLMEGKADRIIPNSIWTVFQRQRGFIESYFAQIRSKVNK